MRVVMDTNVFVSAALKEDSWPGLAVSWLGRHGGLMKSAATASEVFDVFQRPWLAKRTSPAYLMNLKRLFALAEDVKITRLAPICRDEKDNKFLELALNGQADVIVSGDSDLLVLGQIGGIPIINPAAFARALP